MDEIQSSIGDLKVAVAGVAERVGSLSGGNVDIIEALRAAVEEERAKASALAASEDAEDVQQDADLKAATDETDRLLAEAASAAGEIDEQVAALNDIAKTDTPVDPEPGDGGEPEEPTDPEVPGDGGGDTPVDPSDPSVPGDGEDGEPEAPVEETPAEPEVPAEDDPFVRGN